MHWHRLAQTVCLAGGACAALPTSLPAAAGQGAVDVRVTVQVVPSSGVCGLLGSGPAVAVTCGSGGQIPDLPNLPDVPDVSDVPELLPGITGPAQARHPLALFNASTGFRYVGTLPALSGGMEALAVYSGKAEITRWRVISLDNRDYVELTIAW
jgi:hypothetical protein